MTAPVRNVVVWLNGFLPAHIPGATRRLETGPFAGATAIVDHADLPGLYLTDGRLFDGNLNAPQQLGLCAQVTLAGVQSRVQMQSTVQFSLGPPDTLPVPEDGTFPRVAGDCSRMTCELYTPQTLSSHLPVASRIRTLPRMVPLVDPNSVLYLHVSAWTSLPDPQWAERFGDVGGEGIVVVDLHHRRVEFFGEVSRLFAFEMYAMIDQSGALPIFRLSPSRTPDAWTAIGHGRRQVREVVKF